MGEVYLAHDPKLNRNVAIKFLSLGSTTSEQANKRLLREARAAATLDHPNICAVHEVSEEDGRTFIVMQYVKGETLDVLMRQKPLNLSASLSIAVQVADAIAEAHTHGIIHRDIKPSNIIVTPRGQPKVMDFGLATILEAVGTPDTEAATKSLLTTPGTILGTVPYMSPEQVKGEKVDTRTDIFSFGVLLYEMITGRRPFAAKTTAEIISAILTVDPPPLASYVDAIPAGLEQVVRKCLEKDRERRYQTMREAIADLEVVRRGCENGPVPARSDKTTQIITAATLDSDDKSTLRFPARGALAVAAIVMVAVSVSAYLLFIRSSKPQPANIVKPVNSAAYDDYMRGKVLVESQNSRDNEMAISLLEKATKTDPNFAAAWAQLARAYNTKSFYFASDTEKKELRVEVEVAVNRALALDPDLAEGHYARGLILWTHDRLFPHEQAIQSYKRAIALNPNLDDAHQQLGVVYVHIGLFDKASAEINKALEINPGNTMARFRLGVINMYSGKYEEALANLKTTPPDFNPSIISRNLATDLFQLGRTEEAAAVVDEYLKTNAADEGGNVTSVRAMILAKAGKEREAEATIQHAIEIGKNFGHFHHTAYNIASAYAMLNKTDEAVKWLQTASDDGFPCYPLFENDANLNNLRKNERFIAFMKKLKQQWEHYNATL